MYSLIPDKKIEAASAVAKKGSDFWWIVAILSVVAGLVVFVIVSLSYHAPSTTYHDTRSQKAIAAQVGLQAKPWNDGKVHMWAVLSESNDDYTDVPENATCARADDVTYTLGSGSTTLYYYKLACNGVVGYVERDQVR